MGGIVPLRLAGLVRPGSLAVWAFRGGAGKPLCVSRVLAGLVYRI